MKSTAGLSSRLADLQGSSSWRSRSWSTASGAVAKAPPSTASTNSGSNQQPRLITYQITRSRSLADLSAICLAQQQLNPIHISAALNACVRHTRKAGWSQADPYGSQNPYCSLQQHMWQVPPTSTTDHLQLQMLVSQVLVCLQEQLHLCHGREIATILWCLGVLQLSPPPGVVQQLVARFGDVAHASTCQAHSMVLYSLAVLGHKTDPAMLDALLYSMVKAGRLASVWDSQQLHKEHVSHGQATQQQQPCSSQAFANAIWALKRLQQPALAHVWLLPLLSLLHNSVAATVHSSTKQKQPVEAAGHAQDASNHVRSRLVRTVAVSLWTSVMLLEHQQCSNTATVTHAVAVHQLISNSTAAVSALQLRLLPAVQLLASKLLECSSEHLCSASPYETAALLWACIRLQVRPSRDWVQASFAATGPQLSSCSARECVSLLRGMARLRLMPPRSWLACLFTATSRQLSSMTGEQLASLVWSCGTLQIRPPVDWMNTAVRTFATQLNSGSGGDRSQPTPAFISMMVWGASKLGYQPPGPAAECIMQAVQASAADYGPHQASKLLLGCSRLQWKLQPQLLSALLKNLTQQLDRVSPADITMTARALANSHAAVLRAQQQALQQWQHHHDHQQQQQQGSSSLLSPGSLQPAATPEFQHHLHSAEAWHAPAWLRAAELPELVTAIATASKTQLKSPMQQVQRLQWLQLRRQKEQLQQQWELANPAHGQQLQLLYNQAAQLLGAMTPAELCQCLYSAVYLNPKLSWQWSHALNHVLPEQMQQLGPGDLCLLLWSLPRLHGQVQVKRLLHKQLLVHSQKLMLAGRFTPRDLSMFMWHYQSAFRCSRQGLPRAWVAVFSSAARSQLHNFTIKQVGVMLRACVLLDVVLEQQLLKHAGLMLELWSAKLDKGERAMVVASLLQLQQSSMQAATPRVQSHAVRFWPAHPQHDNQQQQQQQQRVVWVQAPRTRYYIHSWDGQSGVVTADDTNMAEPQQRTPGAVLTVLR